MIKALAPIFLTLLTILTILSNYQSYAYFRNELDEIYRLSYTIKYQERLISTLYQFDYESTPKVRKLCLHLLKMRPLFCI